VRYHKTLNIVKMVPSRQMVVIINKWEIVYVLPCSNMDGEL